jgi:sigma-54 specific flagellar transcriptional regulator A
MAVTTSAMAGGFFGLVHGAGSPLIDTKRTCARVAASEASVLLSGETGTGKEVFARFIHASSPRAARPFVPVNCGAIPETLLESELFGYVKGAFTGAVSSRRGRVSMAEGGTLFLDEIGELPLSLQVKLLRLLQERTYEPIGSSESLPANFRLIAATHRDLADEVRGGRFRSDLYYRLHVCPVRLPALRERRGDIAPLFQFFWNRRGETRVVEPAVMQRLEAYAWPGNVRELENLVERVSVCAEGDLIRVTDLPIGIRAPHLGEVDWSESEGRGALALPTVDGARGDEATTGAPTQAALAPTLATTMEPAAFAATVAGVGPDPGMSTISLPSLAAMASELRGAELGARLGDGLDAVRTAGASTGNTPTPIMQFPIDLPSMLRDLENRYINAALLQTRSNKKEAAKLLGMGRTTLVEKLRRRASDRQPGPSEE